MSDSPRHIIRRQVLEIQGVKESDVAKLQAELQLIFSQYIQPLLDQQFHAISSSDEPIRIPRLELDLGMIQRSRLKEEVIQKIQESLAEELVQLVEQLPISEKKENSANFQERHLELLRHFMKTGSLPWWTGDEAKSNPIEESLAFCLK